MPVIPTEPRPFHLGGGGGHRCILGVEAKGIGGVVGEEIDGAVRGSQAHDESVIDCPEEVQPTRAMITPTMLTQQEIDLHRITNLPYHLWCPECVEGFAREGPHRHKEV